jgi:hypothetical protein
MVALNLPWLPAPILLTLRLPRKHLFSTPA